MLTKYEVLFGLTSKKKHNNISVWRNEKYFSVLLKYQLFGYDPIQNEYLQLCQSDIAQIVIADRLAKMKNIFLIILQRNNIVSFANLLLSW